MPGPVRPVGMPDATGSTTRRLFIGTNTACPSEADRADPCRLDRVREGARKMKGHVMGGLS